MDPVNKRLHSDIDIHTGASNAVFATTAHNTNAIHNSERTTSTMINNNNKPITTTPTNIIRHQRGMATPQSIKSDKFVDLGKNITT
ncbi:hypothetical protein BLA29_006797 [Euroglyphus maynei]|uniref:Uncharacterized protein n=1 Tax=Euroglyphus maynei TaxID=6958 RepID=A0A1Y3AQ54_EURMA|nr:hypothetical protein BLA29_006797 [Euroglyphus maynei]